MNMIVFRGKGSYDSTVGLWKGCRYIDGIRVCADLICKASPGVNVSPCVKMETGRAFMTIACIVSFMAAMLLFARVVPQLGANRLIAYTSKGLPVIALIAGAIGYGVGLSFILDDLGATFGIAGILGAVALGLNLFGLLIAAISPFDNS